jgi:hypothetical protein
METRCSASELLAVGVSLQNDAVTAEVVSALDKARVESVLLRGPAIARWLYSDASARPYVDVDLLVAYDQLISAGSVLQGLGFENRTVEGVLSHDRPAHAQTWLRPGNGTALDLHHSLVGARLEPAQVWRVLAAETQTIAVHDTPVAILGIPGRGVVVALHAAQHGAGVGKPLADLARALELMSADHWLAASGLAARLDATEAFAAGLRLLPAGEACANRLRLPEERSAETILRASTPPATALGFDWLARTPGLRGKARLAARKIAPDAAFMRAWSPLARRGHAGLGAAYFWRVAWLVRHAGPGFMAWKRAKRSDRTSRRAA